MQQFDIANQDLWYGNSHLTYLWFYLNMICCWPLWSVIFNYQNFYLLSYLNKICEYLALKSLLSVISFKPSHFSVIFWKFLAIILSWFSYQVTFWSFFRHFSIILYIFFSFLNLGSILLQFLVIFGHFFGNYWTIFGHSRVNFMLVLVGICTWWNVW